MDALQKFEYNNVKVAYLNSSATPTGHRGDSISFKMDIRPDQTASDLTSIRCKQVAKSHFMVIGNFTPQLIITNNLNLLGNNTSSPTIKVEAVLEDASNNVISGSTISRTYTFNTQDPTYSFLRQDGSKEFGQTGIIRTIQDTSNTIKLDGGIYTLNLSYELWDSTNATTSIDMGVSVDWLQ